MAQHDEMGSIIQVVLIGGAAWIAWNLYTAYVLGQQSAAIQGTAPVQVPVPAPTTTTTPPAATAPATPPSVPPIIIPAGFTVTPDINNSYKGTVTYNGSPATLNVILANAGATSGVVYNSTGQDITALLGPANVTTLVNAYQAAANAATVSGVSGLSQIRVPMMLTRRSW